MSLVRTDVSEEHIASSDLLRLLITANVVRNSPILIPPEWKL
jgi:hypothetical protein